MNVQEVRVFNLLYQAVFANDRDAVGTDKQAARRVVRVMDILETAVESVEDGLRLKVAGAHLLFEEAEFTQFQAMWDSFRSTLRMREARDVVAADELVEQAKTYTMDNWVKEQSNQIQLV